MKINVKKLPNDIIKALYAGELKVINDWINKDNVNYLDRDERSLIFHAIFIKNFGN